MIQNNLYDICVLNMYMNILILCKMRIKSDFLLFQICFEMLEIFFLFSEGARIIFYGWRSLQCAGIMSDKKKKNWLLSFYFIFSSDMP